MLMPRRDGWRPRTAVCLVLYVLVCAGCKPEPPPVEQTHLSQLASNYGRYISKNQGKSPPNEAEFKKFIQTVNPEAKVDEMFVSPRDSRPYVIRYGPELGSSALCMHEKTAVDGKWLVGMTTGEVRTVDDAEFKKLSK